jgi:hypothetical protein
MTKMSIAKAALPQPAEKALSLLGADIATARRRRRIPQRLLAERMMVSLPTLQRLEKGDPGVGIGVVATALWTLGLIERLSNLASPDVDGVGKVLEAKRLPKKAHAPAPTESLDF